MVEQKLYFQCIGGTVSVPPLGMEIQTGSPNNHISQISFVFAALMYWWNWLAAPVLLVCYRGIDMLAALALIDRSMTIYWAGVSRKGNGIIPKWRPNKKRKGHL
jgi:hypothetical protein